MAKPRTGWAMALFGVLAIFFLGVVSLGLYSGELRLPTKAFGVTVQRATNPVGFHLTALFYAALAGLSTYPLWLMVRPDRMSPVPTREPQAPAGRVGAGLDLTGRVSVRSDGRSGEVHVALDAGTHPFWWEFGGGDCLAIVSVPAAEEWPRQRLLAAYPREAFLDALAREVGRLQCPSARYEIEAKAILFRQVG